MYSLSYISHIICNVLCISIFPCSMLSKVYIIIKTVTENDVLLKHSVMVYKACCVGVVKGIGIFHRSFVDVSSYVCGRFNHN